MEISEIKSRLSLSMVLSHYNLRTDKNSRLCCPFHDDKTPSLQVYPESNTCYCFSSRCKTHGKSMDVIDFILNFEQISKSEAINKAKGLITNYELKITNVSSQSTCSPVPLSTPRTQFLEKVFSHFCNGIGRSPGAVAYLERRCLDYKALGIGYNNGTFHQGDHKHLIEDGVKVGLLSAVKDREGSYSVFAKGCVCFALRSREDEITGLYFRSIAPSTSSEQSKDQRHYYLKNRSGLYPGYPCKETKTLILTESIIDAASLLELRIKSYELRIDGHWEVLALYGTNGFTDEHRKAIKELDRLEEIIFFFDGDGAGKAATVKYAKELKDSYPKLRITGVNVPDYEDVNTLRQGHTAELLAHLIETRTTLVERGELKVESDFSFSTERTPEHRTIESLNLESLNSKSQAPNSQLETSNPYNLRYTGKAANYQVKGFRSDQSDSLKITLQIVQP